MDDDNGCLLVLLVLMFGGVICTVLCNESYNSGVSTGTSTEKTRIQADAVRTGIGKYRVSDKETGQAEFVWLVPVEEGPTVETLPGK